MRSSFDGQRILVTGANGFIGCHLCLRLCQEGAEVHAVYRSKRPTDVTGLRWWQADLADLDQVRKIGRETRPDLIFHLASHVKGAPDIEHVLPTFQSNLQSTINILILAAELGCRRVVLTGSLAEPEGQNGEAFPSAPYAAAKWASTGYARMFHALYKVPVLIARVFMVYGPGQVDLTKLVPYVTLSLLQGRTPSISSGQRLVDWIHVSDVVEGFLSLGQTPNLDGATLDIGSGSLVSIRDLVQQLIQITGGKSNAQFGALPDRPLEPTRIANIEDTFAKTGWRPRVPLRQGLENTVRWYRAALERSPKSYQLISG